MSHDMNSTTSQKHSGGGLTLLILLSIVLGIGFAITMPQWAVHVELGGEIFLRLLKMMVVPLVITSVMSGILGMGDIRKLGRPGAAAIAYYLSTTILAVIVGLILVNVIRPGVGTMRSEDVAASARVNRSEQAKAEVRQKLSDATGLEEDKIVSVFETLQPEPQKSIWVVLQNLALMLFTDNLFKSAVNMDLLPLIFFSIIFAGMLTTLGTKVTGLTELIDQANHALMAFVMLLMKVAPIGIFCLVAARFGEAQLEGKLLLTLQQMGWYMSTVLLGLAFHSLITLPAILYFFTRRNPYQFIFQMSQALLTAFSTASSSATLPVTMECATVNAKVSEKSAEFVLPLGATINMDGTALYEAAAAIFIAQVAAGQGVVEPLSLAQQAIVAVTATLAAIGAAGIPEAGLVTMLIVLNAVGLPLEYIGLILSVDWLLDRFRTAVNVLGDAMGAAVVDKTMPNP
jgi:Na+/H+-dicarboxylate symporter